MCRSIREVTIQNNQSDFDERRWFNAREHGRGGVEIYADVREHGAGKHKVYIIDLSCSGFRIRSSTHIRADHAIFLTIPGYAALEARICWHEGDQYGCEFVNRLHAAIYDHIVNRFPSLGKPS
jgi:PilZ domain